MLLFWWSLQVNRKRLQRSYIALWLGSKLLNIKHVEWNAKSAFDVQLFRIKEETFIRRLLPKQYFHSETSLLTTGRSICYPIHALLISINYHVNVTHSKILIVAWRNKGADIARMLLFTVTQCTLVDPEFYSHNDKCIYLEMRYILLQNICSLHLS